MSFGRRKHCGFTENLASGSLFNPSPRESPQIQLVVMKNCATVFLLFIIFLLIHSSSDGQNFSQKDRGLVIYKLGSDTTITQYFNFDNRRFETTIISFTGTVTKYEANGELDESGDIKQVSSRIFSLDSLGQWTMSSEATNIFNGDSSIYTARRNGKEIAHRAIAGKDRTAPRMAFP